MSTETVTAQTIALNDCLVLAAERLDVIVEPSNTGFMVYVDVVSREDGEPQTLRFLPADRVVRLA